MLTLVMFVGLFAAMPITAQALSASEAATIINSFDHGGSGSLSATVSGNTVTVTGSVDGATRTLSLDLNSNSKVIWKASYSGINTDWLIQVRGKGALEIAQGGSIICNGGGYCIYVLADSPSITVNGGKISSTANDAIRVYSSAGNTTISVISGTVESVYYDAIALRNTNSSITVSGGVVSSVNGRAIYNSFYGANCHITVSGGAVSSTFGRAIDNQGNNSNVYITGGLVSGYETDCAVFSSNVSITGGLVCGIGTDIVQVWGGTRTISGTAVVCAWKQSAGNTNYSIGTSNDLTVSPAAATAKWDKIGTQSGVSYANGTNTGFVPISGVTATLGNATINPTSVNFPKGSGGDIAVTVDLAGYTPQNIKNGSYTLQFNTDYTISGNTVTFKASYLNTLTVGTHTLVFTFSGGTSPTLTVNVTDGTGSMSNFVKTKTYTSGMFSDVDENAWYGNNQQKVIANAYEYGLMKGDSATTFNPAGNMTIAEAIAVAARVNKIYATGNGDFEQGSVWYQVYVDYVVANNIIAANDFAYYTKAATRAEMAYIFSKALPAAEFASQNTVNSLPDVNNSTPYYSAILVLYKAGVLAGSDAQGTFNPSNNITRAEAAAIISRVILPGTRTSGKTF